jgi:hypothetical protein
MLNAKDGNVNKNLARVAGYPNGKPSGVKFIISLGL